MKEKISLKNTQTASCIVCECISHKNNHKIIGFTQRDVILIGNRFCEYRHVQPAILPLSIENKLRETVPTILSYFGISCGASSIEFIVDCENRLYILEVTPTMYGNYIATHLIPISYGFEYTESVIYISCVKSVKFADNMPIAYSCVDFEYNAASGVRGKYPFLSKPIKELANLRKSMSYLTKELLRAVDYKKEKYSRKQNFNILHSYLDKYNLISIDGDSDYAPSFTRCWYLRISAAALSIKNIYPLNVEKDTFRGICRLY